MKSRNLATISLAVMALGFLATLFLPDYTGVELLRGGFEAGLVGGLADWFAVTALFRHPLGLKIPHTSLLLKNRDKIIQSLISAMENELLNKESIRAKLRTVRFVPLASRQLTRFFAGRERRRMLLDQAELLVRRLPAEQAVPHLQAALAAYLKEAQLDKAAETVLDRMIGDGKDREAMDYALTQVSGWAERPETRAMLGSIAAAKLAEVKLGGLKGMAFQAFVSFVDESMLGDLLQNMLLSAVRDLQDEESSYRGSILQEIRIALYSLIQDEERIRRLKEWGAAELQGEAAAAFLLARAEELRGGVLRMIDEDRAAGGRRVWALYALLIRRLGQETELIAQWETRVTEALVGLVEKNHYRIGVLVKENLDQMDDASLVAMLEEKVGRDLQWIRVNGAICGFAVGLVLTVIQLI
ncbi:DUF445 domain-containing protein [Paenibacillus spiritus]|uniref:DUF445 domain-containing protein n=1 Tax=Paenibacillus spiritus TaxID=2496557 RepID=A0A5J5FT45_9BACL|nr:DUF445 domain-containing protein [Paenibacillus spiritus]KAA8996218.1 DUF445 domain-containing protein [Paenibacillus spiritus]